MVFRDAQNLFLGASYATEIRYLQGQVYNSVWNSIFRYRRWHKQPLIKITVMQMNLKHLQWNRRTMGSWTIFKGG